MLLLNKEDFALQADRRVVKATDVATVKSAAEIIAAAEAEAARIKSDAKVAYEIEKKRGYEKGLADGKAEIVLTALKSFMVEVGDREMVVQIVRKTMNAVIRTQRQVTLKVAPEQVETVRARVAEFRTAYPTVENFDVVEDPRLKGPACILETEAGVADASVDTQLAAIEKSIRRHIDKGA